MYIDSFRRAPKGKQRPRQRACATLFCFLSFVRKLCEEVARVGETMEPSKAIKRQDEKARNKKIKGNLATQLACMSS